jgi:FlaG/FlaF family flagellin (archaellin)
VGAFALGLAENSAEETPSASIEISWGTDGGADTVDVTIVGGNAVEAKYVTVSLEGTVIWDEGVPGSVDFTTYDSKTWSADKITAGDTLGLKETATNAIEADDTLKVIWNNGEKSQVLGSGTNS